MNAPGNVGGKPLRLLLVEDSEDDATLLLRELRQGGYRPSHRRVATPEAFIAALDEQPWDLILCDFTMPGFSGTQALALLRSRGMDIPFIYVSGTIGEETAVAAMRAGAHDYVLKDNLQRLVPAIERELREAEGRRARAHAEAEQRVAEARFREVLAMAPDAIVAVDHDQRIILFNRAAEALFGYTAEEVSGQFLDLLLPSELAAAHRKQVAEFMRARFAARQMSERGEIRGRRKNGEEFPAIASIAKIAENGSSMNIAIVSDVTERKLMETQLLQAQKMEAVGQLTGGLAHDFNNLLTIAIGNLDQLCEELEAQTESKTEILALARVALDANLRGAQLTRQLLAFSRRQTLETRVFDLNRLTADTLELLKRALGGQIEIETRLAADLRSALADPTQVESALVNLAINARDAMPNGGRLTIETENRRLDADSISGSLEVAPGNYVMLAVTDNGEGIAPENLDKVFEPFFTTKEHGKGTGLGLSMIYGFARQSGGQLKIYSEPGQGTTVRLYLPRAEAEAPAPAVESAALSEQQPGDAWVLVVEDDPDVRHVAVNLMTRLGYRVLEADSDREALAQLRADQPIDLLFTDVVMPGGLSGIELAREARRLRPGLRVLLTSGYAEAALAGRTAGGEVEAILAKPYRKEELARKVRQVLGEQC